MALHCGIIGLPNVGKSTLFNALTKASIAAENYPFCTIDPNVGIVTVPDTRLDCLAAIVNPEKVIPTTMEFIDIAGLVEGASQGEGLGNQFLATIRETEAIIHVLRCFMDENIVHVAGKIDPIADIKIINTELALADIATVEKSLARASKVARIGDKKEQIRKALFEQVLVHLDSGAGVRTLVLNDDEKLILRDLHLLTVKPVLYIANVQEDGFTNNPMLALVQKHAAQEGAEVVVICAAIEAEIALLDAQEKQEFLNDLGFDEPGLHRVIKAGYRLLKLSTYFTAGIKEVRAWTIPAGTLAPQAAAAIHTDFEKGFIRAEVIGYDDFISSKGEQGAKDTGKWRLEGKEYRVQDGDVVHFRFNV